MITSSTPLGEKIRLIRNAEGLTRLEFAALTGVNAGSLKQSELGQRKTINSDFLEKITNNPTLNKYALWLMTGSVSSKAGQIAPTTSSEATEGQNEDNAQTAKTEDIKNSIIEAVFALVNTDMIKLGDGVKVTHVTNAIFEEITESNATADADTKHDKAM
ncbi:helix-turn-helix domain-containing protein [Psychrobium sp. nBUS_13]|uniref:helix-turn-helix domain-containing protein n=1 Tax=Psychrobium sp. nBUS_13 TaxID=3395319 RepID=UPI003EC09B63